MLSAVTAHAAGGGGGPSPSSSCGVGASASRGDAVAAPRGHAARASEPSPSPSPERKCRREKDERISRQRPSSPTGARLRIYATKLHLLAVAQRRRVLV